VPLAGTFLVAAVDETGRRVELMDVVDRKPVRSSGTFDAKQARVSTYRLVGAQYFQFFALVMAAVGVLFIFVAAFYREKTHLRDESTSAGRATAEGET
jgi:POT family proton-dependent oligopeptide transporter